MWYANYFFDLVCNDRNTAWRMCYKLSGGGFSVREPSMNNIQKDEILKKCFAYFVEHGLESISMRKMCDETGMAMSSAYYWCKDKDEAVLDSAEYGLNVVTDKLFNYVFSHIEDIKEVINSFPEKLMEYKKELRFIYQVTTSNQYGDRMRLIADKLDFTYDAYAMKLADRLGCEYEVLQAFVYLFISATLDYIVWEDKGKVSREMNAIYTALKMLSKSDI